MRTVGFVILSVALVGCATVNIEHATVLTESDDSVQILLVTDKHLSTFDNTFCVYQVNLNYAVEPTQITRTLNSDADIWQFPFGGLHRRYVDCPVNYSGYCSTWVLRKSGVANINNIRYEYDLHNKSKINLRLSGGNMLGCELASHVVSLEIDP
jgi:hypothetical protein